MVQQFNSTDIFLLQDRNNHEVGAGWKSQWLGIDLKLLGKTGTSTLTK